MKGITGTLHNDVCEFISPCFLLRVRNFSAEIGIENQIKHLILNNFIPPPPTKIVPFTR
jgi:hypothetical protein